MNRKGSSAIFRLILSCAGLTAAMAVYILGLVVGVPAQSDDDPVRAVKDTVTRYYSSFEKREMRRLGEFWEPNSVGLPEAKDELAAAFGRSGSVRLNSIEFQTVRLDADVASVALKVELFAFESETGRRVLAFGSGNRIVTLRQSGGKWLLTSDQSAERLLAKRIADARDGDERSKILGEDSRLVNDFTGAEIVEEARRRFGTIPDSDVISIYRFGADIAAKFAQDELQFQQAFERALRIVTAIGDRDCMARLNLVLGIVAIDRERNPRKALAYFETSRTLARDIGDGSLVALSLLRTGMIHNGTGDFLAALGAFRDALRTGEQAGDRRRTASALNDIGIALSNLGTDPDEAIANFERSYEIATALGNINLASTVLYNIGVLHFENGDFASAMKYYRRSVAVAGKVHFGVGINIAQLHARQGNPELALEYLRKVNPLLDDRWSLGTAAEAFFIKGDLVNAIENQKKALALWEKDENLPEIVLALTSLGEMYLALGDRVGASESFDRAVVAAEKMGNDQYLYRAHLSIAELRLSGGQFSAAIDASNRSLGYFSKTAGFAVDWRLYAVLSESYRGIGDTGRALEFAQLAIETVESRRVRVAGGDLERQRYFQDKSRPYVSMVDILASGNRPDEAFLFAERARSRVLLDILKSAKGETVYGTSPEERRAEIRLRTELASLNSRIGVEREKRSNGPEFLAGLQKELEARRLKLEDLQAQLREKHPQSGIARGEFDPLTISDLDKIVDESTAVLEFVVGESETRLITIVRDRRTGLSFKSFRITIKRKDLAVAVGKFRTEVASGGLGFQTSARELFDLLLGPAESAIAGRTKLIVVPDTALWDLPFQALHSGASGFLVERASVSYAPSLTALREIRGKARPRASGSMSELLALGNPAVDKSTSDLLRQVFMDEKLEPLPEAERLVKSLGTMYGAKRSRILFGAEAREETLKSEIGKYRIVQFAAHGILNDVSPMYSHIVLSQKENSPTEDGLLEAWEMKDLELNADLVILSGCETARGRFGGGEGVIGMTWAMFIAGAPSTVASQWKVESSSTTELMLEFHRQLLSGKVSKAEALRRASLKIMKVPKYRHPSYWAGWVLVGDGS